MQYSTKKARIATMAAAVGVSASLLIGASAPAARASTRAASTLFVTGAGSTFINPLMTNWTRAYSATVDKTTRINYQSIGSGAGVSALTSGTVDFAGSDAFLSDAQLATLKGNALHVPLTIGPVAMLYNLPGVNTLKLDGPTLAQIFFGKITSWNDKAIASLNPGVNLPNTTITVVHRSDGSGTSFIFTNYLSAVSSDWKANVGAATAVSWPTGQGGKGSPGLVQIVKRTPGAITYAELTYAVSSGLPAAQIKNKSGQFVAPSPAGASASASGAGTIPVDLRALIVDGTGNTVYPISGFSWAIIYKTVANAGLAQRYTALLKFLWWATHDGQKGFPSAGPLRYAPLPASIVSADEKQIKSVTYNGKALYNG